MWEYKTITLIGDAGKSSKPIDVPENVMGNIFDLLKKRGFIRGIGRMNSDEARKHGAYSIMWVDRHIAV